MNQPFAMFVTSLNQEIIFTVEGDRIFTRTDGGVPVGDLELTLDEAEEFAAVLAAAVEAHRASHGGDDA